MRRTTESRSNGTNTSRRADVLKQGLLEQRQQLQDAVRDRIRAGRARGTQEGTDDLEHSEFDVQNELTLSLLQMHSETLLAVDAALARLEAGGYGLCAECAREIATRRLRAMPFAVRCQTCEEKREDARNDEQRTALGRGRLSRFAPASSV